MQKIDLYDYCVKNPLSAITATTRRIRNICNISDVIVCNCSGGKDSTLTFNILVKEILTRRNNHKNNFEEDIVIGESNSNIPIIILNSIDPEIIYTQTRDVLFYDIILPNAFGLYFVDGKYIGGHEPYEIEGYDCLYAFSNAGNFTDCDLKFEGKLDNFKHGYNKKHNIIEVVKGTGIIRPFYKCLPISFQNISDFNGKRFVSWEDDYVQPIPTVKELSCQPITENYSDFIADSLIPSWSNSNKYWGFGDNPVDSTLYRKASRKITPWSWYGIVDEGGLKSESYKFEQWIGENTPDDFVITSLVSIRADESPARNITLKKADLNTGIYGYILDRRKKNENS